jgi:hypothetical protein
MKKTLLSLALLAASSANALVTYTGSTDSGVLPPDNDFEEGLPVLFGREVSVDGPATITMTAIFSEADYTNAFITVGGTTFSNVIDGSSLTFDYAGGLLPFSFFVIDTGNSVINGSNQFNWESDLLLPYFAVTEVLEQDGTESFLIGLNDNSGFDGDSIDLDVDDYVIRVEVTAPQVEVPEPLPAALLGLGLIGIGLARIKARRAK